MTEPSSGWLENLGDVESTAVVQAFLQGAPSAVVVRGEAHPSGWRFALVNRPFATLVGGTVAEVLATDPHRFTTEADRRSEAPLARAALKGERDHYTVRKPFQCLDGRARWVEVTNHAVRAADGSFAFWWSAVRDIDAEVRLRAEVEARAAELEQVRCVQDLVATLTSTLIDADEAGLDAATNVALEQIGRALDVSVACVGVPDPDDPSSLRITHIWDDPARAARPPEVGAVFPRLLDLEALRSPNAVVRVSNLDELPDHWEGVRSALERDHVAALIQVYAARGGALQAAVALADDAERPWPELLDTPLRMLADAVARARSEREIERRVRSSEERYRRLVEHSPTLVSRWDGAGRCLFASERTARVLFGRTAAEVEGRSLVELGGDPVTVATTEVLLAEALETDQPVERDYQVRLPDGERGWFEGRFIPDPGPEGPGVLVELLPVTDLRRVEAELAHQMLHDPLTGLPNRALVVRTIQDLLDRRHPGDHQVGLLVVDMARLDVINDAVGHDAGDHALVSLARRLRRLTDPRPVRVGRVGGDEFAVVYESAASPEELLQRARGVRTKVGGACRFGTEELDIGVYVGAALSGDTPSAESLVGAASAALHVAQRGEQDTSGVAVFTESLAQRASMRHSIERDLRRAIETGELTVHYQPEWWADGTLSGAEALIRWFPAGRPPIRPDEFLGVAEDTGLIRAIGQFVLTEAAKATVRWRRAIPTFVTWVNLTAKELSHPGLVASVLRAASAAGLEPGGLGIEVTERSLIDDLDAAAALLRRLQEEAGASAAIDDFGTGFSSLSLLQRLPLAFVKIDRSFVNGVCTRPTDQSIIAAVVAMAHQLGLQCVAEGVEEVEQMHALGAMGVDVYQGYLLGRPGPAAAIDALVVDGRHPLITPAPNTA